MEGWRAKSLMAWRLSCAPDGLDRLHVEGLDGVLNTQLSGRSSLEPQKESPRSQEAPLGGQQQQTAIF